MLVVSFLISVAHSDALARVVTAQESAQPTPHDKKNKSDKTNLNDFNFRFRRRNKQAACCVRHAVVVVCIVRFVHTATAIGV